MRGRTRGMAMTEDITEKQEASAEATITFKEFLESVPPGTEKHVAVVALPRRGGGRLVAHPDILLHCSSDICGGIRTFASSSEVIITDFDASKDCYLHYICQNCRRNFKKFSLHVKISEGRVTKFGEMPSFGPPTPAKAIALIGSDRDLFLKGRKCENQGLGVGAFTYYRRVIEDQKGRIFDEVIRVLEATDPTNEVIGELRAAKNETQFSKSIEAIKHALPASLMINGQNPLRLLHSALSEGVHALSDEECLDLATAARTILIEFSEKLSQALRDDAALASAVNLLSKPRASVDKKEGMKK